MLRKILCLLGFHKSIWVDKVGKIVNEPFHYTSFECKYCHRLLNLGVDIKDLVKHY
jgi:hypothetical protein